MKPGIKKSVLWGAIAACAVLLAACGGGDDGDGNDASVASIAVTPASATIGVGDTQQFNAVAKDSSGATVSGVTFTWKSSDASVASVDSEGVATGKASGSVQITASANGVTSGAATLEVAGETAEVRGVVSNSRDGTRFDGVTVSAGGKTTTTDERGMFHLKAVPVADSTTISFDKEGYSHNYTSVTQANVGKPVMVSLKELGAAQDYDPSQEVTLYENTANGPYAVILEPDSLDTDDTALTVAITPLDPTRELDVLPELVTEGAVLMPLTFAEYTILDSDGNEVELKAGASAVVELPIPVSLRALPQYQISDDPNNPTIIHCYSYNPKTGQWEDFVVGKVVASSIDGQTPVIRATVKHFSWYGAAPEAQNCSPVAGMVVDAATGDPIKEAFVQAVPGLFQTTTGADGNFVVWVPTGNGNATVTAQYASVDSDGSVTGSAGTYAIFSGEAANVTLDPALSIPCSDVGSAPTITPPPPTPVTIELGYIGTATYSVIAYITPSDSPTVRLREMQRQGVRLPQSAQRLIGGSSLMAAENGNVIVMLSANALPGGEANTAPVSNATVTVTAPNGTATVLTVTGGTGFYQGIVGYVAGGAYTLTVDADGNGSIDGSGTVRAVGLPSWDNPTEGETLAADGLTAKWSDSGTVMEGYAALYFVELLSDDANGGAGDGSFYLGTARQFTPHHLDYSWMSNSDEPLFPGTYTGDVFPINGPWPNPETSFTTVNNITGTTANGAFYSLGETATVHFTLN
ncbi:MAG TPA: Ig-like domain-containing protein [Gammaproteobacteria bacterium]|nr:Ig-like domain-containing protein [Gammaproteobacteria bacterium]